MWALISGRSTGASTDMLLSRSRRITWIFWLFTGRRLSLCSTLTPQRRGKGIVSTHCFPSLRISTGFGAAFFLISCVRFRLATGQQSAHFHALMPVLRDIGMLLTFEH